MMSANNFGKCPKCKRINHLDIERFKKRVGEAYGKVPQNDYTNMRDDLETKISKVLEETLREDFEIKIDEEGVFNIGYYCSCDRCGFKYSFQKNDPVDLK